MKEVIHQPRYLLLAAHKLYQLALCLRQMQATDHGDIELDLEGSPLEMADRFVTAADHVTSQDFLAKSVQGMELMMAQAYCRIYLGDPASMRPIFHRALTYGHILEIDKAADEGNESMWFRLVYAERFLALGLGRQPFPMDDGFASDRLLATSNVTKRLERIHVLIAGRIIDRNLRIEQRRSDSAGNNAQDEYKQTQDIDHQLKQAARCAPIDWWAIPDAASIGNKTFFTHVLTQIHHYYLLILNHQRYIVGSTDVEHLDTAGYSQQVAVSASREVLTRFRIFKHIPTYQLLLWVWDRKL